MHLKTLACMLNRSYFRSFSSPAKQRVLSGIQPTGSLHIGNYIGALKQWVANQNNYENFFCVVDLHAITVPHNVKKLKEETLQAAAIYIAAGIDPEKSHIFVQSHVSAHAELAWLLNCITPMSWLERMIQYKEKAIKQGDNVHAGLLNYPVLMAADILLYDTSLVPVGEDQRQHLELCRDICRRFNDQYGKKNKPVLREPDALIMESGARVMSLLDGRSKMSKSSDSDGSRINILDPPDVIRKKIKRCKTDSFKGIEWREDRPECSNLLGIYQAMTGLSKEEVERSVADMNWGQFKPLLTEAVVEHLTPIQTRYHDIIQDDEKLSAILADGRNHANAVAEHNLRKVKRAMGYHVV